jgi:hypothetical protein
MNIPSTKRIADLTAKYEEAQQLAESIKLDLDIETELREAYYHDDDLYPAHYLISFDELGGKAFQALWQKLEYCNAVETGVAYLVDTVVPQEALTTLKKTNAALEAQKDAVQS